MFSIKEAHYKFKQHANKVDGLRNANFLIPQIDEYLFEAYIIYIENTNSEQLINLIKITDILGRIVDSNYQGIVLYYYSDGKVVKAIQ
jgi:hypothetical protein